MTQSPFDAVITSLHNPAIRRARSLLRRKGRVEERAFLVEGIRAVSDAMDTGAQPQALYLRDDIEGQEWRDEYEDSHIYIRMVAPEVFASISDVPHPQSVIAEFAIDDLDTSARHDAWEDDLILVADGVRDPGNMGTLIRTSAGAGVTELIISPESVDPFNPKCIRSAMGAHFLVAIRQLSVDQIVERLADMPMVAVADANAEMDYDQADWNQPSVIIIGGEAFGANQPIRDLATTSVRIPLSRHLESLNAGVAGSHLVLEAARQRRSGR